MLLTITTDLNPATDLGYLLHKHPARAQSFELGFGRAHVFYPEASDVCCTAALLLEIDPVGLVRGRPAAADRFGYAARFEPIGPLDDALGSPTQMAAFITLTRHLEHSLSSRAKSFMALRAATVHENRVWGGPAGLCTDRRRIRWPPDLLPTT